MADKGSDGHRELVVFRAPAAFAMGERVRILRDMRAPFRTLLLLLAMFASIGTPDRVIAQQGAQTPEQFFGFRPGRRRRAGPLSESPRVLPAAREDDRPGEVRGAGQDDDGQLVRAAPHQLAAEPGAGSIGCVEINRRLADPRGLSDGEAQKLAAEGKPFYLLYATIHSTEVSNGQAITHIVHRLATENSPLIREILDNSVVLLVPSQNPDGQHLVDRPLVQDEGHGVQSRLSRPVPQVRRPRRQPRLVHVHAERNAHEHRAGAEQVQADHHARHAPAGRDRLAHLRAALHRSVRREHAPDPAARTGDGGAGDGDGAAGRGQGRRRLEPTRTTCGRRRDSTWSITASRAS